jgi:hypothetical protein
MMDFVNGKDDYPIYYGYEMDNNPNVPKPPTRLNSVHHFGKS